MATTSERALAADGADVPAGEHPPTDAEQKMALDLLADAGWPPA